jgi:D-glycero-D-manno-heptose 1,7-bisphosphate phosphatase
MLIKAAEDFNIDLTQSYMVGDSENDIKVGLAAGCRTVLVNGEGSLCEDRDIQQDYTVESILEFVEKYLCL